MMGAHSFTILQPKHKKRRKKLGGKRHCHLLFAHGINLFKPKDLRPWRYNEVILRGRVK